MSLDEVSHKPLLLFYMLFSLIVCAQKFNKAAEDVQNLKSKPTNEDLLEIYALFKQGQVGDVNTGERGDYCLLL